MILTCCIAAVTCAVMILSVLFFPKIKLGRSLISTYWVVVTAGAVLTVITGNTKIEYIVSKLTENTAINPLKILVLFISMTVLSVFLDELGFFRYLANETLKRAKTSQTKLFIYLYLIVSVLTVFTSNDIIILSFTPFICYFSKNAKINPVPYLSAEFVAANTWSMALIIGNPTNIYLSTACGISFLGYLKIMILPTVCAGIVAFAALYFLFRKELRQPIEGSYEKTEIKNKPLLVIGLIHLAVCTVFLAVSSYCGIEMWIISLGSAISLFVISSFYSIFAKRKPTELLSSLKRAPWQLIPFVLSMFVIILVLSNNGVTGLMTEVLGTKDDFSTTFRYGYSSFFAANLINNIPMSVLFASILGPLTGNALTSALFASIIGSNIGAFFTPVGALAGIMWSSIIASQKITYRYRDFLKMGIFVAIPTITAALLTLNLVLE